MGLEDWGWDDAWAELFAPLELEGWRPGRVVTPGRGAHRVITADNNEKLGRLTGKAMSNGEAPTAGDWVAWREEGNTVLIGAVLPRRSAVSRKMAGAVSREQTMGANIDVLFIVQALGSRRSFTNRGLERYVTMGWESGARPVVVLNKADLDRDALSRRSEAEQAAPGVEVVLCSTVEPQGIDKLKHLLKPRLTGAFVGPSGVGKTSLVNTLAGKVLGRTGKVRRHDHRGRHVTVRRELYRLPDGRVVLDTPGLRELQIWGDEGAVDAAFPEIEEAAGECRFRNCRHETEPGCAVRSGLEDGSIKSDRYKSWLALRRESVCLETRRDARAKKEYMEKGIQVSRDSRQMKKNNAPGRGRNEEF